MSTIINFNLTNCNNHKLLFRRTTRRRLARARPRQHVVARPNFVHSRAGIPCREKFCFLCTFSANARYVIESPNFNEERRTSQTKESCCQRLSFHRLAFQQDYLFPTLQSLSQQTQHYKLLCRYLYGKCSDEILSLLLIAQTFTANTLLATGLNHPHFLRIPLVKKNIPPIKLLPPLLWGTDSCFREHYNLNFFQSLVSFTRIDTLTEPF